MANFNAGGLASGIDTNSIVDSLVKLESRPLDILHSHQAALSTQVSLIGDLSSKLSTFKTAIAALSTAGALGVTSTNATTAFSVAPGSSTTPGSYDVAVTGLASAAKLRSQAYASPSSPVIGGTLTLNVKGTATDVAIVDGTPLDQVALQINQSGAAVNAVVLSDGTSSYLSITNRDTGFTIGGVAANALTVSMAATGSTGAALTTSSINTATNATFTVDGLSITRQSNTVVDAIPGATMVLKAVSPLSGGLPVSETALLTTDVDATAKNLGAFVTAFNDLLKAVQKQVTVVPGTSRATTLAGDSTVRGLERALQGLVSTQVPGIANVRTLADLGIKTAQDGSISLDADVLKRAVASNPAAINQLFSQQTTGLSALGGKLVDSYVNSTDGLLVTRSAGLTKNIKQLDDDAVRMQARIDTFRNNLIAQFTAMESVVSSLKSIGNFLNSQFANNTSNKS